MSDKQLVSKAGPYKCAQSWPWAGQTTSNNGIKSSDNGIIKHELMSHWVLV